MVALLLADAASEGKAVITWMLGVGLLICAVIALGELTHYLAVRRARRRVVRY